MRSIGIVRKVDTLGRLVIPKELRREMGIEDKDPIEIFVDRDAIILKRYMPACAFCEGTENIVEFNHIKVCRNCFESLQKLFQQKS